MSTDNGGPAFPAIQWEHAGDKSWKLWLPGMSLRDYFAAAALTGLTANPHLSEWAERMERDGNEVRRSIATAAYATADAILAERAKGAK